MISSNKLPEECKDEIRQKLQEISESEDEFTSLFMTTEHDVFEWVRYALSWVLGNLDELRSPGNDLNE